MVFYELFFILISYHHVILSHFVFWNNLFFYSIIDIILKLINYKIYLKMYLKLKFYLIIYVWIMWPDIAILARTIPIYMQLSRLILWSIQDSKMYWLLLDVSLWSRLQIIIYFYALYFCAFGVNADIHNTCFIIY